MDKFVDKDGKVVLTITDSNEEVKDEKYFKDKKEAETCTTDGKCKACDCE